MVVIRDSVGLLFGLEAAVPAAPQLFRMGCDRPIEVRASRAGDLGYSYGSCETKAPDGDTLHYIRVWRRDPGAEWKMLLDLVNVTPPALKQSSR